jgi:cobaltochelatase CobT
MTDAAVARARLQQQVEELSVAAIRALAGERDLHFRGRRLHRGARRLPYFAPHLHPVLEGDDFASFRGAADGLALRLRHSNAALHAQLEPADAAERLVFGLLEQFRCEALADAAHAGVAHNLRHRFEAWSEAFHRSGLTDTARGLLLYALAQITRARITAEPVLEATEGLIESTRFALAPAIGVPLAGLRRERHDQAAFAPHALAIARTVGEMLQASAQDDEGPGRPAERDTQPTPAFSLLLDPDAELEGGIASVETGHSRVLAGSPDGYRIHTRAFDREVPAATLLRAPVLAAHRERLDARVAAQGVNLPRLARALQALLAEPADDGWDGAQEQGRIDGRRLAQLVAVPTERRLFRTERLAPVCDAALTVLVDCSGSMKAHAESVAMLAELLLRAAEMVGVRTELLGFSTGAWHGGRAMRQWQREGRPPHPGRLAETLHLVFKHADEPWRRARRGVAAMLEPTLFREGVDGEAVAWACARLRAQPVRHRLLLVVSDGCPMEGATQLANDEHYLDHHLREVVAQQEAQQDLAIFGVGVGLDLSPYYGRCQALDLAAPPGNAVFGELLQLLAGRRRR